MLENLRVEYKREPLGMDEMQPRFSWETKLPHQRKFHLQVKAGRQLVLDKKCVSSQTAQVVYDGAGLKPFTRYDWSVTAYGDDGEKECGSSFFETGFMGTAWSAPWIQAGTFEATPEVRVLRTLFKVPAGINNGRLCITAKGVFEAKLNGQEIADDLMPPGWTQYDKRLQYRVYDITALLSKGDNRLDIDLANGWYSGSIARLWNSNRSTWGAVPQLRAEIRLLDKSGKLHLIPLDAANTKHCYINDKADIYSGTTVEAWHRKPLQEERFWQPVIELKENPRKPEANIVWSCSEPVAHIMDLKPVSITKRPNGAYIVDFGQNLVGREKITLRNNVQGTLITIRHGEMLREDGSLYYDNLRTAQARTVYVSGTEKCETFEPRFTFYGFRYLDISGWPGKLTDKDIVARAIYTKLAETGRFTSSDKMLNQLQSNIVWGQRGNFVDVPTDCPQRDERQGWTADTQVFADEATWNMDAASFYTKWIADLNASQSTNGGYSNVVPNPFCYADGYKYIGATGWSDAGIVCPWVMMEKYGDLRIAEKYMPQMLKWLDWEISKSNYTYILDVAYFGDWLFIGMDKEGKESPNYTPGNYLSSAYLAGMLRLAARMLKLLGHEAEAKHRQSQYEEACLAMQSTFLDKKGNPLIKTQTALAMAIVWELFKPASLKKAGELLVHSIRDINACHLTTGFLGTPLLLDALVKIERVDLAYELLFQKSYPGWMYPITQGATTMWERWNSYTRKEGFGDVGMNSFNHYAYGAVGAWFYRTICGIQPLSDKADDLGFAHFRLAPQFGHILKSASAEYKSIRGTISSSWKRLANGRIEWKYTIPPNTTAEICLPGQKPYTASGSGKVLCSASLKK